MKPIFVALSVAFAGAIMPSARAIAGEACTDACSGNFGPDPCGAFGLGCPPGGGQCIQCTGDRDCQPGGTCVIASGQCVNLPCSPGAPMDASAAMDAIAFDAGGGGMDAAPPPEAGPGEDSAPVGGDSGPVPPEDGAVTPDAVTPEIGPRDARAGGSDRRESDGCSCAAITTTARGAGDVPVGSLFVIFLAVQFLAVLFVD